MSASLPRHRRYDVVVVGGAWADETTALDTPAARWGVATSRDAILLCGSGAQRGGAVSGIGGHNAAQAVLELT
jgi:phytoene dehydrogenase-like protein